MIKEKSYIDLALDFCSGIIVEEADVIVCLFVLVFFRDVITLVR